MLSIKFLVTETESEDQTRSKLYLVLLKTLENLKQQPVFQDSPKDALSDLSLGIELAVTFTPNQDSQDIPQQLQPGEVEHYNSSE
ncbi:hypothetical protein TNCV_204421 [Trichonephila clavipes]|nr:hypothetical protein TNCV_204421 [Trichonephila clavipes]